MIIISRNCKKLSNCGQLTNWCYWGKIVYNDKINSPETNFNKLNHLIRQLYFIFSQLYCLILKNI